MDHIKNEKLQAMNKYKRNQFLHNLMLCSFIALACVLFCSSPLWLPPIYSFIKLFLFVYIPSIKAYMFNPKCLFVVCNVIVVILIGESKLAGSNPNSNSNSNSSHATNEIYDEYVSRSASLRRARAPVEKKYMEMKMEVLEREVNVKTRDEVDDKEVQENVGEEVLEREAYVKTRDEVDDKEVQENVGEDGLDVDDDKLGLPAEELNKRVEEFIARVNRQRRLEASILLSSYE